MTLSNAQRAHILVEALPYIQKYNNKIVVVKYGGAAMTEEHLKKDVMRDIVLMSSIGMKVVLVHGGGPEITGMLNKIGKKTEFVNGLRVTDRETADIVQMVLCGRINKNLVSMLQSYGGKAIGICGHDGSLIKARKISEQLGFVGEITDINKSVIEDLLEKGYIPVISTVGCDDDMNTYNINADTASSAIASALNAECLISMTDTPGLLSDKNDQKSLISKISVSDASRLIREGAIEGGMIPKVQCCIEAVRRGVKRVFIIDGRIPHSILIETLTDEGIGTMFA
ncbi:MAG TPA: acetylglutamate kinase [Clostridia bacterium]|jgi:acetylglutamate kinase|nr:acetylglutamate kinase [Clostridiaceae bacterium]HOF26449.1 acetylglutamate kinase [Clostridia bacterium]HOM34090.1 acetylglutamate kinase [Clostridia bacterium]HOR89670.1 acetylglutamate kinase [Clostridia bacterium]HOT71177.1 acetylglutamate kinase [Clostridia bacterium]